ncbi:hypothetical protein BDQ17DRAFT_1333945 [Cyathus striatus]|nr:hypothetical protein BDQ17DRAFT_1333945 [Cyathus striatus]
MGMNNTPAINWTSTSGGNELWKGSLDEMQHSTERFSIILYNRLKAAYGRSFSQKARSIPHTKGTPQGEGVWIYGMHEDVKSTRCVRALWSRESGACLLDNSVPGKEYHVMTERSWYEESAKEMGKDVRCRAIQWN